MRDYSCKCGKATSWGSMPPKKCVSCSDCGTTMELLSRKQECREPDPHEMVTRYNETTGTPYQVCAMCGYRLDGGRE